MRGHLVWAIGLLAVTFVLIDRPVREFGRLFFAESQSSANSRQPVSGLAIIVDFKARRNGRRVAVLARDWFYCYPKTGEVFMVPKGFETDFASIPRGARALVNPFGNHAEAAVIHDWLYAVGEDGGRSKADAIFRYAMKEQRVNIARRRIMHRSVRVGGNSAYGRDDEWRFRDPVTLKTAAPPIPKPEQAAVDVIDCNYLDSEVFRLIERHGTG